MQNHQTGPEESSHLLNRFDQDPGPWRPFNYSVEIDVGVDEGGIGRGQITTNQQPYIFTRLSSMIIGNTGDPQTSGLFQDGQYTISYKDEISNYQKEPTMAPILCGSVESGFIAWLAMPLALAGTRTVTFELVNRVQRILTPEATTFKVAITMHGMADWGSLLNQIPR